MTQSIVFYLRSVICYQIFLNPFHRVQRKQYSKFIGSSHAFYSELISDIYNVLFIIHVICLFALS